MLPAFFVLIGMGYFGLSFWPAVALGTVVSIVTLGFLFKRLMVDPMIRHGVLPLVIATIGLTILMKESVREFYGADAQPFPPLAAATNVTVFGAAIDVQSLVVLAVSITAVVALPLFLNGTRTGRCMQATAQNPTVARLLGIPVERMILYTFLINAALVTLAAAISRQMILLVIKKVLQLRLNAARMPTSQQRNDELPSHHLSGFEGAAFARTSTPAVFEKHDGADRTSLVRRQINLVQRQKGVYQSKVA
jgi:branched-subunit amino acid ABC-type transport system permease component